jgi:putative tributyrin esterase
MIKIQINLIGGLMAVIHTNFLSKSLGRQVSFNAIIPTFSIDDAFKQNNDVYKQKKKFKTLWLLHGFSGDEHDYINYTNVALYAQKYQIVVIMPPACNQGYSDDPDGAKHFSFVAKEMIEAARFLFPLSDAREDNFIGGLSMGALGAMKISLAYPEYFSKVLLMSGCAMEITGKGYSVNWFGSSSDAYSGYVMGNEMRYKQTIEDAYYMMRKNSEANKPLPTYFLTVGSQDYLLERCRYAKEKFESYQYPLKYEEIEGYGHNWDFWELKLKEAFETFF